MISIILAAILLIVGDLLLVNSTNVQMMTGEHLAVIACGVLLTGVLIMVGYIAHLLGQDRE